MGSTLEHGIYLPSEGEKNCYQGLAGNWNKVDGALGDVAELKQSIESKFTKEIVTELPTEDINPYCIYMILKTDPETDNVYDEWVYINNNWEYLGNTKVDMTQYYTKQEVNQLPAVASGVTATKVGNYDAHIANGDIHVTASDKTKWTNSANTHVLRLALSALTPSTSDNSFSNLDDSTALKVGDKVMDTAGVLFEVTAIDTANSTFTIGTALIDLLSSEDVGAVALSNNYNDLDNLPTIPTVNDATLTIQKNGSTVKTFTANASSNVTCNITVPTKTSELTNDSGFLTSHQSLSSCVKNVVTNNQTIKSTAITRGTAPSSVQTFGIPFADNNNKYIGNIYGVFATDMSTFVGLYAYKGSTTSNSDNASVRVGYDTSGNAYTYAPTPATADNSTQIATTAFVKAQGYLTSHQSLANYVTTNTDQTVDGNKTFSKYITSDGSSTGDEYSSNTRTNLWLMGNRDTEEVSGILFDSYRQNTAQGTGIHILGIGIKENNVRYEGCRWGWYWDSNLNGYTFDFKPTTQGANQAVEHNLGTSTDKWDTINGLNPSALGMPDLSNGIDISGYITNFGAGTVNEYTPVADGWISIASSGDSPVFIRVYNDYGFEQIAYSERNEVGGTTGGTYTRFGSLMIPCVKNVKIYIIVSPSTSVLVSAKFFPCQGNV